MNNVMISGRFGRDPEIRYSKSGMAVVSGTIANNVPKKDGTKKTNWIDIVAFDKTAEKIASDFSKGDQIGVQGQLSEETWTDQSTGQTRRKTQVIVSTIIWDAVRTKDNRQQQSTHNPTQYGSIPPATQPQSSWDDPF